MDGTNPKVDDYLDRASQWQAEMKALRAILLGCGLTEELKWGQPCYTFAEHNVVLLQGFKHSCVMLFTKGALLADPDGILQKPGENTQATRRIPFTNVREIVEMGPILETYLYEAIEVEKAGLEVNYKKTSELVVPAEVQNKLAATPAWKAAFEALTPGRQRGYLLYFSAPKQPRTRESRVEKCTPRILAGKGLHDR